jgi:hypothetical protein
MTLFSYQRLNSDKFCHILQEKAGFFSHVWGRTGLIFLRYLPTIRTVFSQPGNKEQRQQVKPKYLAIVNFPISMVIHYEGSFLL